MERRLTKEEIKSFAMDEGLDAKTSESQKKFENFIAEYVLDCRKRGQTKMLNLRQASQIDTRTGTTITVESVANQRPMLPDHQWGINQDA